MARRDDKLLDVRERGAWRTWLAEHHASESAVWVVFHKRHTGVACLEYEAAVEEALCFGWVDSLIKRLDEDRFARKFTPRTPDSRWSTINRKRYARLAAEGRLAAPGRARAPTGRSGDAPKPPVEQTGYLEERLKQSRKARQFFESLAPSYRAMYVGWVESAKREATREKRLREALALLTAGKKLGMK